jgi:hypothetical protein
MQTRYIANECKKILISSKKRRHQTIRFKLNQMSEEERIDYYKRKGARREEKDEYYKQWVKDCKLKMFELKILYANDIKDKDLREQVKLSIDLFDDCFIRWSDSHRKHSLHLLYMVKSNIQKEEDALKKMERVLG